MWNLSKKGSHAHAGEERTEIKDKGIQLSAAWSKKYARNVLAMHHGENVSIGRQSRQMTIFGDGERELSVEEEVLSSVVTKSSHYF